MSTCGLVVGHCPRTIHGSSGKVTVARRTGLFCVLLLFGYSSLLPPNVSTSSDACYYFDDGYLVWHVVGIASGGLAGATGADCDARGPAVR